MLSDLFLSHFDCLTDLTILKLLIYLMNFDCQFAILDDFLKSLKIKQTYK